MKRYEFEQQHGELGQMRLESDGEWIRYADHVEAMKRIAGDGAQQPIPVAEVTAGNLGRRLMWHTEDAQSLTPVGTLLYAAPAPAPAWPAALTEDQIAVRAGIPFVGLSVTLMKALRRLSFAAQTSGGGAGRDDELMGAIKQAQEALEAAKGKGLEEVAVDPAPASSEAASPANQVEDAHPDDAAVNRFAAAMKAKMAASRVKGRAGWDDPEQCAPEFLASMLIDHLHKGDPVDVGNFAMMLFNRPDARGVLAQVWATRYGQDAASPAKCDGTVSNCPNECSAPCSPSELPAMTDAQIETILRVREHEPTIFIEDEILSNYDEMREEVWEAIKSYADIHARAALQQCRALLATEKKCTRCEYIGHCDCEVMESK